ncbi:hypothetical protein [Microbacterium tenebrionis]|uniref:hypothetical protein n=1 Tax=Microbacterium tenebrionis TaxID=2830665 RepID=UPI00158D8AFC|nr:hypothetical protein [Microbacterium ihumii]
MDATRIVTAAAALLLAAGLAGCGGPPSGESASPSESPATETPEPAASATPDPTATPTAEAIPIPDDCRAILSDDVLAQLDGIPLNDPAFGATGIQPDGSLICAWGDPAADTTGLTTTISHLNRGPALDLLNELADDEDFVCFTPDKGIRCEKTWPNENYPVTDGRTLFWREDVLIDTRYSNLAPSGYTASIVAHLFD